MPRVVHFDIDAENPEQLVEFHGKVFGWKFMKWEGPMEYWLITTGGKGEPGIDGGLSRRTPGRPTFDTIDVPDIDEYMKKVEENGGTIMGPKMPIPGIGWFASFKDVEGNMFGLMEDDPEAK